MTTIALVFPNGDESYVDAPAVPRVGERVRLTPYKGDEPSGTPADFAVAEVRHELRTYHRRDGVHYWDGVVVRLAVVS